MLEKLYSSAVVVFKMAAGWDIPNATLHKRDIPGWNKNMGAKCEVAQHAYIRDTSILVDNHSPKSGLLFDIMKKSRKELNYALRVKYLGVHSMPQ